MAKEAIDRQPRILVIDDDESILNLVEDALSFDYSVSTANDGSRGLDLLVCEPFDLLILDLGLPELDGVEIIRRLREHTDRKRMPILVVSAYTELRRHVSDLDVDGVLSKPFSLRELERQVSELVPPAGRAGDRQAGQTAGAASI